MAVRHRGAHRAWRPSFVRRRATDGGSASLEIAVLFPVVLLLVFAVIQGALYYHARNVALAAASDGLTAARAGRAAARKGAARRHRSSSEPGVATSCSAHTWRPSGAAPRRR